MADTTVPNPAAPTPPTTPTGLQAPQNQHGFAVPPAGSTTPNSEPHQYPNQRPGYVRKEAQTQGQADGKQTTAQTPEIPEGLDIAALINNALGQKSATADTTPSTEDRPAWLPDNLAKFDVETIDDPIIKSMATVLQVAGKDLDLNRVLGNALAHSDPALVDVAYIAEKGGANAQQLAEIAKGIVQAIAAKSDSITSEVHAIAGGADAWSRSASIFNDGAPEALRMTVKAMLDSTNAEYIKAAAKIVTEFGKASGVVPRPGANISTAAGGAVAQGLSAAQFKAEIFKLNQNSPGYLEARNELFARRAIGKRAGM